MAKLLCTCREPNKTVGGVIWTDLTTVAGYRRRIKQAVPTEGWSFSIERPLTENIYGPCEVVLSGTIAKRNSLYCGIIEKS